MGGEGFSLVGVMLEGVGRKDANHNFPLHSVNGMNNAELLRVGNGDCGGQAKECMRLSEILEVSESWHSE